MSAKRSGRDPQPKRQPPAESAAEPPAEPPARSGSEPPAKPVAASAAERSAQSAAEPLAESVAASDRSARSGSEPPAKPVTASAADRSAQSATDRSAQSGAEPPAEPVAASAAEPPAEPPADPRAQSAAEPPAEASAEPAAHPHPHARATSSHKGTLALRLLGASVLAGGLAAALALPVVAAVGMTGKAAVTGFESIPDTFTAPALSQASTVYDSAGGVIATVYSRDRTVVPLTKIAPVMQHALIDIEDARFYDHGAIDLRGTLRALSENLGSAQVSQGGSTLTQQYVKNVFVEQAGDDQQAVLEAQRQTVGRKIAEMKYAIRLEETLSKDQILADYLNITFFGEQAYGIEAAAERYFSVHASELTLTQAATLAGLVQSPSRYDPVLNPDEAKARRDTVLDAMAANNSITADQATAAKAQPLGLAVSRPQQGCITAQKGEAFFCDYVQHVFLNSTAFGATAAEREQLWDAGGLKIHTTLDPIAQTAAQKAVTSHVYATDRAAAAVSLVQPGTGKILGMAQSRPYGPGDHQTELNYNVDRLMGGGNGFQTGSTFKPVTAAAALEAGISMSQSFPAPYQDDYPAMRTCDGAVLPQVPGDQNDSPSLVGPFTMPDAMAQSVNTYFVPLEAKTGLCKVVQMAGKLGLGSQALVDKPGHLKPIDQVQSLTLGTNNFTPLQMAAVYATFAARGHYCAPIALTSVTTPDHRSIPVPAASCRRVMTVHTADSITTMLHGVVQDGTGAPAGLSDRDDAGKTGTTDGHRQVWFTGFTAQVSAATVVSDTQAPLGSLSYRSYAGQSIGEAFGGTLAGPIWKEAMTGALHGQPSLSLAKVTLPTPPPPSSDSVAAKPAAKPAAKHAAAPARRPAAKKKPAARPRAGHPAHRKAHH
ncbi:transglycosylase domain-containing protein [Streptacidiphilus cavernicola]|uniref:Transglycosylase domain-containing protein n=1 Tax=Streptacidiphilus cavernicola TaxID=3342716 RepID=A0ABV6VPX1_9ACTN